MAKRDSKANTAKETTITLASMLDKNGDDAKFRELLHNIFAFSSKIEAIRGEFGKIIGLTGIEFTCLIATAHLRQHDKVYVNSLADHLHLSGAFITLQTNKLAEKGHLSKTKDSNDARRVLLEVTETGQQALSNLGLTQQQVNDILFAGIDQQSFAALCEAFRVLVGNSDQAFKLANYLSNSAT
ncbi:MarR family winged helix-turn-helix transcriptional regulator [Pseudomonas sp. zfem002]|uniref:MarR family winged helix-turn-helix transcriptional regulator n=1 Tax=Pseudomonas sp. zfem002 TaxID=3078197 RepID=UPI0029298BF8|nr:MarR family winged helix-turn-helix transcriptional regulator [Pseudomonas sp. zfem002]MDU9392306.1 MarR family winged helix-turn-helix transcriptional regulator [Pseudomonas sp. zfem002]